MVAACSVNRAKYVITILQVNAALWCGQGGCFCGSVSSLYDLLRRFALLFGSPHICLSFRSSVRMIQFAPPPTGRIFVKFDMCEIFETRRDEQRRKYSKMDKRAKDKMVVSPRENGGG